MGKIKNVFTTASLYFIKLLFSFSLKLLPFFIIAIILLKLTKVFLIGLKPIIIIIVIEIILIIFYSIFYSVFFKNKETISNQVNDKEITNENNTEIIVKRKLPILNISVAFFVFLGFIFILLKLFNALNWSWIWVLSPLWLSSALAIIVLIICIIAFIVSFIKQNKKLKSENIKNE